MADVGQQEQAANEETKRGLEEEQTKNYQSEEQSRLNPKETYRDIPTKTGIYRMGEHGGTVEPLKNDAGEQLQPPEKAPPEGELPLGDAEIASLNKLLPPDQQLTKGATEKQVDRLQKILSTQTAEKDRVANQAATKADREAAHADAEKYRQAMLALASRREGREESKTEEHPSSTCLRKMALSRFLRAALFLRMQSALAALINKESRAARKRRPFRDRPKRPKKIMTSPNNLRTSQVPPMTSR